MKHRYCTKMKIECAYTTAKKRGPAPKKVKIGKFSIFASASEGYPLPSPPPPPACSTSCSHPSFLHSWEVSIYLRSSRFKIVTKNFFFYLSSLSAFFLYLATRTTSPRLLPTLFATSHSPSTLTIHYRHSHSPPTCYLLSISTCHHVLISCFRVPIHPRNKRYTRCMFTFQCSKINHARLIFFYLFPP